MKSAKIFFVAALGLLTLASCGQKPACCNEPIAKHVVFIGLDGWSAKSWDESVMPVTKGLAAEGAYTVEKRSVLPSSSTINWASMFMGVPTEVHGWVSNDHDPNFQQPTGAIVKNNIMPTVFQLLRDQQPDADIACFFQWSGIKYVVDTLSLSYFYKGQPQEITDASVAYIKEHKPTLIATVIDRPDHPGHDTGYCSPEYYDALTELDGYIGQIVDAVKEAGILDETVFVITGDHGGIGRGHGGTSMDEMLTPFILNGKGIKKGFVITDLTMQYDVAATMARVLGLKTPQMWVGRPACSAFAK